MIIILVLILYIGVLTKKSNCETLTDIVALNFENNNPKHQMTLGPCVVADKLIKRFI